MLIIEVRTRVSHYAFYTAFDERQSRPQHSEKHFLFGDVPFKVKLRGKRETQAELELTSSYSEKLLNFALDVCVVRSTDP